MTETSLGDRLAGGVWGHLVGDAVGVPYEFGPRIAPGKVRFGATGAHSQPPGTWSDDGALMLALLDSLLEKGFDTTDQARHALAWYRDGAYTPDHAGRFDVGNATRAALTRFENGTPAEECGLPDAAGNGSLMRILPLALVERDTPDAELVDHAQRASRVTHGDLRAHVCCALYVLIARDLLAGATGRPAVLASAIARLRLLLDDAQSVAALDFTLDYAERGGRGRVWDGFWSAWDAFAGADSYEQAIRGAVAYGDDTDTTAAIAGGLAGIYWGVDGIPAEWFDGMRGKSDVWPMLARLLAGAGYRTDQLRVAWVQTFGMAGLIGATGRLGMTFLPGKRYPGRGGDHWRDVSADVAALREVHKVDALVLLVEDHELEWARVRGLESALRAAGIELVRHPIKDFGIPADPDAFRATLRDVMARLRAGEDVAVACMGGLGRTGTFVGCLLREAGAQFDDAVILPRLAREGAIETEEQKHYVVSWPRPDYDNYGMPVPKPFRVNQTSIGVVVGDLIRTDAHAIVNAANSELWMGSGVAGAIKRAGGQGIEAEAMAQGPIKPGEAVATSAGSLPAPIRWVIHAATMGSDLQTSEDYIRRATASALAAAVRVGAKSVAMPAFGTGVGGFPFERAAEVMVAQAIAAAQAGEAPERVLFVVRGESAAAAFRRALEEGYAAPPSV